MENDDNINQKVEDFQYTDPPDQFVPAWVCGGPYIPAGYDPVDGSPLAYFDGGASREVPSMPSLECTHAATPDFPHGRGFQVGFMGSVQEARAWRLQAQTPVTNPFVPPEFEADAQNYVTRIYDSIANCATALDGQRRTSGRGVTIRASKGYYAILNRCFDHGDIEAASWIIWDNLLQLHKEGSSLVAGRDFPRNTRDDIKDIDLNISERLDKVVCLLSSFKSTCLEALGAEERKIQIIVRAPVAILRTKRLYQASNDRRQDVYQNAYQFLNTQEQRQGDATAFEVSEDDPFERFGKAHSTFNFWPTLTSPLFGGSGGGTSSST